MSRSAKYSHTSPKDSYYAGELMTDQCKKIVMALAGLLFSMASARGQAPIYQSRPPGEFFTRWLLCGPFPNPPDTLGQSHTEYLPGFYYDYLLVHGGETGL